MVPLPEDHQMSAILGAPHPWIEAQVSSCLESPKTKIELIQLALRIEATSSFRLIGAGRQANRVIPGRPRNTVDNVGGTRPAKLSRSEDETGGSLLGSPVRARPRREDPTLPQTRRDYSKTKCYNCCQLGHISTDCNLPPRNKAPHLERA